MLKFGLESIPCVPGVGLTAVGGHLVLWTHLESGGRRLLHAAVVATLCVRSLLLGEFEQLLAQLAGAAAAGAPLDRFQPPLPVELRLVAEALGRDAIGLNNCPNICPKNRPRDE